MRNLTKNEQTEIITTLDELLSRVGKCLSDELESDYVAKSTEFTLQYGENSLVFKNNNPIIVLEGAFISGSIDIHEHYKLWSELIDSPNVVDNVMQKATDKEVYQMAKELRFFSLKELEHIYVSPNKDKFFNEHFKSSYEAITAMSASSSYNLTDQYVTLKGNQLISMNDPEYRSYLMESSKEIIEAYLKQLKNARVHELKEFIEELVRAD